MTIGCEVRGRIVRMRTIIISGERRAPAMSDHLGRPLRSGCSQSVASDGLTLSAALPSFAAAQGVARHRWRERIFCLNGVNSLPDRGCPSVGARLVAQRPVGPPNQGTLVLLLDPHPVAPQKNSTASGRCLNRHSPSQWLVTVAKTTRLSRFSPAGGATTWTSLIPTLGATLRSSVSVVARKTRGCAS